MVSIVSTAAPRLLIASLNRIFLLARDPLAWPMAVCRNVSSCPWRVDGSDTEESSVIARPISVSIGRFISPSSLVRMARTGLRPLRTLCMVPMALSLFPIAKECASTFRRNEFSSRAISLNSAYNLPNSSDRGSLSKSMSSPLFFMFRTWFWKSSTGRMTIAHSL